MEHFGKRLRRLRGDRSQKEVASEVGMPQTTLSTLENQEAVPRGEVVERLAKFYNVPVAYFYPSPPARATQAASAWLKSLKQPARGEDTVATHATLVLDEETKQKIAERIKQKLAKTED